MTTRPPPTGARTASQAIKMFRNPFGVEWIDDRANYGEERINLLGMCDGVILHVTYIERGEHIRLISARRAEKHEQDHYYRENSALSGCPHAADDGAGG
jgi:uncharacterized protein